MNWRESTSFGCRIRHGERGTENCVRSEPRFLRRSIEFNQSSIDFRLIVSVTTHERCSNFCLHVLNRLSNARAIESRFTSISQFHRFETSSACTTRNNRTAGASPSASHFDFDGRFASAVEDFTGMNLFNTTCHLRLLSV